MTRLRMARQARGLTLRELAHFVGVSHTLVWRLERGEGGSAGLKVRVARALGVPVAELFPADEREPVA